MLKYKIPQIVTLTQQNHKITAKEKGTVVNQDYRSSFIESRTDDVMKLRMT